MKALLDILEDAEREIDAEEGELVKEMVKERLREVREAERVLKRLKRKLEDTLKKSPEDLL